MKTNTFTIIPERGDIVVKNQSNDVFFVKLESFSPASLPASYTSFGVVANRIGNEVLIAYKNNSSQAYCDRPWWYLYDFNLDNTARTGVLSVRRADDNWTTNYDVTISYKASNISDFVSALNTAFSNNTTLSAQEWVAELDGNSQTRVKVYCKGINYNQYSSNTAKNGFSITACIPEIDKSTYMLRKNGVKNSLGAGCNIKRMEVYFSSDLSDVSYNPTSVLTSIKTTNPVCLPAYEGRSQITGRTDCCAVLRNYYGEGETGWKKHLQAQMIVNPSDWGLNGIRNGLETTNLLASFTYGNSQPHCKAASYVKGINVIANGIDGWHIPSVSELNYLANGIEYGTTGKTRDDDLLNKGLNKIGGTAISNQSYLWSCCRCDAGGAWRGGSGGIFGNSGMYGTFVVVPVSLYKLQSNS